MRREVLRGCDPLLGRWLQQLPLVAGFLRDVQLLFLRSDKKKKSIYLWERLLGRLRIWSRGTGETAQTASVLGRRRIPRLNTCPRRFRRPGRVPQVVCVDRTGQRPRREAASSQEG